MRIRSFFRAALLGLTSILPAVVPAAAQSGKPPLVLTLAPYDQLKSDFLYLANLAGQVQYAALIEMTELQAGNGGLGIDRKKPMGGYGWFGPQGDAPKFVLLIPVTDEAAFIDMLGTADIKPTKGDEGVYSANLKDVPDPLYLRFANGYAYLTARDKHVLADERLPAPGDVLAGPECSDATGRLCRNGSEALLTVDIDRIPDALKDQAVASFAQALELMQALQEAKAGNMPRLQTESQRKLRLAMTEEIVRSMKADLSEASETSMRLDLDRAAGEIALTTRSTAKPGTAKAARIQELAQARGIAVGPIRKDAAISGAVHMRMSLLPNFRGIWDSVLEDRRGEVLAGAKDERARAALSTAFDAFMPTLKAAEFDGAFNLQGPDGNGLYTLVGGLGLKDGARVEQAFRQEGPKDPTAEVRFDVDRVGTTGIHRLLAWKTDSDADRILGGNTAYVAFRDDAMFVAMGSGGLGALKDALAAAPSVGKAMDLQVAASRLVPFIKEPAAQEMARKLFADEKGGSDRIGVTLEGGDAATLRLTVGTKSILAWFMPFEVRTQVGACSTGTTGPDGACMAVPARPTEK